MMNTSMKTHHDFISRISFTHNFRQGSETFISCIFFFCVSPSAEEQAQQRLQAEEAEEQYQNILRMLNATTRKTQKKE